MVELRQQLTQARMPVPQGMPVLSGASGTGIRACVFPPPCARPTPLLRCLHETSRNRVRLNVPNNLPQFMRVPNPMIIGLILPKTLANSPQQQIAGSRCESLDRLSNSRNRHSGIQYHMHMIRHDAKSQEVVKLELALAKLQRVCDALGDGGFAEPHRAADCVVHGLVEGYERAAMISDSLQMCAGTVQAPRQKQRSALWMPVRQVALIVRHKECVILRADCSQKTHRQECLCH